MKIKSKYILDRDDIRELVSLIDNFMANCPDDAEDFDCERLYGAMWSLKDNMDWDDGIVIGDCSVSIEHGVTRQ